MDDKQESKNTRLFDRISLSSYEPEQEDIERALGTEEIMRRREAGWNGVIQGSENG